LSKACTPTRICLFRFCHFSTLSRSPRVFPDLPTKPRGLDVFDDPLPVVFSPSFSGTPPSDRFVHLLRLKVPLLIRTHSPIFCSPLPISPGLFGSFFLCLWAAFPQFCCSLTSPAFYLWGSLPFSPSFVGSLPVPVRALVPALHLFLRPLHEWAVFSSLCFRFFLFMEPTCPMCDAKSPCVTPSPLPPPKDFTFLATFVSFFPLYVPPVYLQRIVPPYSLLL